MSSSSPHHKGDPNAMKLDDKDKRVILFKPRALTIIWGGDSRYWIVPPPDKLNDPAELVQVSWLQVTGRVDPSKLTAGTEYEVIFKLRLKPDAFGWSDSPVYFVLILDEQQTQWKSVDLSSYKTEEDFDIKSDRLKFKNTGFKDIQFGMYEIWKGRWKGGLVIREVVIQPIPPTPTAPKPAAPKPAAPTPAAPA